jgi:hypothetical protein
MERYHATSVLSLTARMGQQSGARHTTPAWFQEIYFRPRRFTSSRTCATMLKRAVFSEGAAARPITASQPPVRAD